MYKSDSTTEQKQSSYVKRFSIIAGSALEEAECFVASLKTLQASLNSDSNNPVALEQELKGAMEQYKRLTLVFDIVKVFNPFKSSPSPSPQPQVTPTLPIKEEPAEIKPSQLLQLAYHNEEPRKEAVATTSMPSNKPEPMGTTPNVANSSFTHQDHRSSPTAAPTAPTQNPLPTLPTNNHQARSDEVRKNTINNTMEGQQSLPTGSTGSTGSNNTKVATRARSSSRDHTPLNDRPPVRPPNKAAAPSITDPPTTVGISTEEFLKSFEQLLHYFSNINKLSPDNTWERLLIHSLPQEQKDWFVKHLQGKDYNWAAARKLFLKEYSSNAIHHNYEPKPDRNRIQDRKAQYAQALLTLEMQDNDDLKEFNDKFKRYSDSAGMTCDYSLLKRYVNSLAKRFRELAMPLLNKPEFVNNLYALMQQVEALEQPLPGLVVTDENCSHRWQNKGFSSVWPTQKRRAVDNTMVAPEKRMKFQPVA